MTGISKIKIVKLGVIAALLCSSSAYAQSGPWKLSETSGQVTIARSGIIKVAIKGNSLKSGDVVKTGLKGRAVLTRGEQYMVVSPNSHIEIASPKSNGYLTQIIEYFGNVIFKVNKKDKQHFGVKTPYMAAVVKGTTFSVTVGETGSAVQVTEGAVEVSTLDGGAKDLLGPGNIGMVDGADPFSLNVFNGQNKRIESPNKVATPVKRSTQSTVAVQSAANPSTAIVQQTVMTTPDPQPVPTTLAITSAISYGPVNHTLVTNGTINENRPTLVSYQSQTEKDADGVGAAEVGGPNDNDRDPTSNIQKRDGSGEKRGDDEIVKEQNDPEEPQAPKSDDPAEATQPEGDNPAEPSQPEGDDPEEPKQPKGTDNDGDDDDGKGKDKDPKAPKDTDPEEPKEPKGKDKDGDDDGGKGKGNDPKAPMEPKDKDPKEPKDPKDKEPKEPKGKGKDDDDDGKRGKGKGKDKDGDDDDDGKGGKGKGKDPKDKGPKEPKEPKGKDPKGPKGPKGKDPKEPKEPKGKDPKGPKGPKGSRK